MEARDLAVKMLESYTDEQINEMENVKIHIEDAGDIAEYEVYKVSNLETTTNNTQKGK